MCFFPCVFFFSLIRSDDPVWWSGPMSRSNDPVRRSDVRSDDPMIRSRFCHRRSCFFFFFLTRRSSKSSDDVREKEMLKLTWLWLLWEMWRWDDNEETWPGNYSVWSWENCVGTENTASRLFTVVQSTHWTGFRFYNKMGDLLEMPRAELLGNSGWVEFQWISGWVEGFSSGAQVFRPHKNRLCKNLLSISENEYWKKKNLWIKVLLLIFIGQKFYLHIRKCPI